MQKSQDSTMYNSQYLASIKDDQACKKQQSTTNNKGNDQRIKTTTESTQMFKLPDNYIKRLIITIFHMFKSYVETWNT